MPLHCVALHWWQAIKCHRENQKSKMKTSLTCTEIKRKATHAGGKPAIVKPRHAATLNVIVLSMAKVQYKTNNWKHFASLARFSCAHFSCSNNSVLSTLTMMTTQHKQTYSFTLHSLSFNRSVSFFSETCAKPM